MIQHKNMHKQIHKHLLKLQKLPRSKTHPLIYHINKKFHISKRTLFYIKEYGPHSNTAHVIIRESLNIIILASILSSFGGRALESIRTLFISVTPLLIMLPILNDLIGDYGAVVSSRFSTMLHRGEVSKEPFDTPLLRKLIKQILVIACITGSVCIALGFITSSFTGYVLTMQDVMKITFIVFADIFFLIILIFFLAVYVGTYFDKRKKDPSNFLVPTTTAVADVGNMILLAMLVRVFY